MDWQKKDPLYKIPIKIKLPLGFVALYLAVFAIGGYFVLTSVYTPLNREILLRLQSESLAQAMLFDKKLESLSRRAEDFASDGFIRTQVELLVSQKNGTPERLSDRQITQVRQRLQTHLRLNKLPLVSAFIDLYVYDLQLRKLVGVRPAAPAIQDYLQPIVREEQRIISAIIPQNEIDSFPTAAILTPIWDIEHKKRIGFLACHFHFARLLQEMSKNSASAISETTMEKYLTFVDQSGARLEVPWWFLEKLRDGADATALERDIGLKILPANQLNSSSRHAGRHLCQNGKEMFGQSYPLASANWRTLIELSTTDALKPLRVLEGKLLGIALIVALTTLVLLFFPIQYMIRPLGALQRMAAKITEGDFSARVQVNSEDEIGSLAKTFNLMAGGIEEKTRSLEQTAEDLQKRERELRIEHDRLHTVVHSMIDGLVLLNAQGEMLLSNQAAAPVVNWLFKSQQQLDIRKCERKDGEHRNCKACLLDFARTTSCILTIDDCIFEVISTTMLAVEDAPGKILMARDITERERMNERQAHQERLAVLGKLAAVVAHELNSPLAAISMYNQMMGSELVEDSPFQEHVEVINRNTQTCQRIIKELLDYARIPQPNIEKVDVHEILANVLRFLRPLHKEKNIRFSHSFAATRYTFLGDATQMQQVFINLVLNAMQAVPAENGQIAIRTFDGEDAHALVVEIEDNGPGIDPKYVEEIFEPFFTTKSAGGTGLGLPTAKRIVNAHGGELLLHKTTAGKTVFRALLSLAEKKEQRTIPVNDLHVMNT